MHTCSGAILRPRATAVYGSQLSMVLSSVLLFSANAAITERTTLTFRASDFLILNLDFWRGL